MDFDWAKFLNDPLDAVGEIIHNVIHAEHCLANQSIIIESGAMELKMEHMLGDADQDDTLSRNCNNLATMHKTLLTNMHKPRASVTRKRT